MAFGKSKPSSVRLMLSDPFSDAVVFYAAQARILFVAASDAVKSTSSP